MNTLPNLCKLCVNRTGVLFNNVNDAVQDENTNADFANGMCAICQADMDGPAQGTAGGDTSVMVLTETCGHVFHAVCLGGWVARTRKPDCPLCRRPLNDAQMQQLAPITPATLDPVAANALLWETVLAGDLEGVERAVAAGADVNHVPDDGLPIPALSLAIWQGEYDIAEYLLTQQADPNGRAQADPQNLPATPLMYMMVQAEPDFALINRLVQAGADVNAFHGRNTALTLAAGREGELYEMVGTMLVRQLLEDHNANPNIDQQRNVHQPLAIATQSANYDAVQLLLIAGANPLSRFIDASGRQSIALDIAIQRGYFRIADLLNRAIDEAMEQRRRRENPVYREAREREEARVREAEEERRRQLDAVPGPDRQRSNQDIWDQLDAMDEES